MNLLVATSICKAESRDKWQKPELLFKSLEFNSKEDVFCEIGSGDGYFSIKALAHAKKVIASDVDLKVLEKLKEKIKTKNFRNIEVVKSTYTDPLFNSTKCDIIFMGMVYHHIENRVSYLKNLKKYLKKNGRIVNLDNVIDVKKYEGTGKRIPAKECRFSKEKFLEEATQAGYRVYKKHDLLRMQYFVELKSI